MGQKGIDFSARDLIVVLDQGTTTIMGKFKVVFSAASFILGMAVAAQGIQAADGELEALQPFNATKIVVDFAQKRDYTSQERDYTSKQRKTEAQGEKKEKKEMKEKADNPGNGTVDTIKKLKGLFGR